MLYASDNEPGDSPSDRAVRELARDADVLTYDAQYSRHRLRDEKKGWGHSTWEEGVEIARQAGVGELILFHHDPDSDGEAIRRMEAEARSHFSNCRAAFEGMEIVF